MRLTVATATLFSQALPASTNEFSTSIQLNDDHDVFHSNSITMANFLNGEVELIPRLKHSTRRKVSTLLAERGQANGILRNKQFHPVGKECKPLSEDPDIGILSCAKGQFCMATEDANLGGVCSVATLARKLTKSGQKISSHCQSNSNSLYKCDCTNYDISTASGTITCNVYPYKCVGCTNYCLSGNATVHLTTGGNVSEYTYCYDVKKPYAVTACGSFYYTTNTCAYSINGVKCNICTNTTFDCTNIPHGLKGSMHGSLHPLPIMAQLNALNPSTTCAPGQSPSTTQAGSNPTATKSETYRARLGTAIMAFVGLGSILLSHFTV